MEITKSNIHERGPNAYDIIILPEYMRDHDLNYVKRMNRIWSSLPARNAISDSHMYTVMAYFIVWCDKESSTAVMQE